MVLLSTPNKCLGKEVLKLIFNYTPNLGKYNIDHSHFGCLVKAFVRDAKKNSLIEMVLLSTHNKCFG